MSATLPYRLDRVQPDRLLPFNTRQVGDFYFLSNPLGEHTILRTDELSAFVEGTLATDSARFAELASKGFIAGELTSDQYHERFWARRQHLLQGPVLHGMVLTERCNHGCQYCHSSVVGMGRTDTDMSPEVAEKCVDFALRTTAPGLTIEFQGGEPMANWDTLVHTVEYAKRRNALVGKDLALSLVTNLSLMTEERLDYLLENRVQICTSLDGPQALHDKVRIFKGGNSWECVTTWLRRINERYGEMGLDQTLYRAEALPTITRHSLPFHKEIVDIYVSLGCRALFLRVLDPFGFAAASSKTLGYSMSDFLEFYRRTVDYIIELNKQGVQIMERLAAIMLSKMIGGSDPNYLDLRSPGGAVIGQLAYHPSGRIYSSDEGRMVAAMGDEFFHVGHVDDEYTDLMARPAVRALVLASTNEALPGCVSCAYKPYCGQQPEYNYVTQGSLQGRMPESTWCQKHMGIFDYLARRLDSADAEEMAIFERWMINRPQEHFLQPA